LLYNYIVEDNAQKIYLVPIPALEKEKAPENGNIKSLENALLEMERGDIHQKADFNGCECCAMSSNHPSMCCGKKKKNILLPPELKQRESVRSPTTSWDHQPCSRKR